MPPTLSSLPICRSAFSRIESNNIKQSQAKTVTAYLKEVPAERTAALKKLRDLCRKHLTGFEKGITYGRPTYSCNGEAEVGFASQKHFIGLYTRRVRTDGMRAHRELLNVKGVSMGKGALRYSKPEHIDFNVVESMLCATQESEGQVCQ